MRVALSRMAIALSLAALVPVCAAKSYVVLLKNPFEVENHVHIINSKGTFGISYPGYGAPIGQDIQTVRRYEPAQVNADFSDAMKGMAAILAAGLPAAGFTGFAATRQILHGFDATSDRIIGSDD